MEGEQDHPEDGDALMKTRSRGKITLADGEEIVFTSACPLWLARMLFKIKFIRPVGRCPDGSTRALDNEQIVNLIIVHQNPRRR
jgi:hypothetical protein